MVRGGKKVEGWLRREVKLSAFKKKSMGKKCCTERGKKAKNCVSGIGGKGS